MSCARTDPNWQNMCARARVLHIPPNKYGLHYQIVIVHITYTSEITHQSALKGLDNEHGDPSALSDVRYLVGVCPIHPINRSDLNRNRNRQIGTMFFTGKTYVKHRPDQHDSSQDSHIYRTTRIQNKGSKQGFTHTPDSSIYRIILCAENRCFQYRQRQPIHSPNTLSLQHPHPYTLPDTSRASIWQSPEAMAIIVVPSRPFVTCVHPPRTPAEKQERGAETKIRTNQKKKKKNVASKLLKQGHVCNRL